MIKSITRFFVALNRNGKLALLTLVFVLVGTCLILKPTKPQIKEVTQQAVLGAVDEKPQASTESTVTPTVVAATSGAVTSPKPVAPQTVPDCAPQGSPLIRPVSMSGLGAGFHQQGPNISNYQVFGNTPITIYNQMLACGPLFANGVRFGASTAYHFNWQFDTEATPTGCSLRNIRVAVRSDVIMPAWQRQAGASNAAANYWNMASTKLLDHELGHVNIANQAARSLYDQLLSLPPAASCSVITGTANSLGQQTWQTAQAAQANYDSTTDHGRN